MLPSSMKLKIWGKSESLCAALAAGVPLPAGSG